MEGVASKAPGRFLLRNVLAVGDETLLGGLWLLRTGRVFLNG